MREDGPPRLAEALIRLVIRGEERLALLGDLEETFGALAATKGRERARRWYWKEAIATFMYSSVRAIEKHLTVVAAVALGVVGGVGLIATAILTTRGWYGFFVYAALMIAIALYVRIRRVATFSRRFALTLTTFMTMTFLMYWFVMKSNDVPYLPLWGHVWRIGLAFALGSNRRCDRGRLFEYQVVAVPNLPVRSRHCGCFPHGRAARALLADSVARNSAIHLLRELAARRLGVGFYGSGCIAVGLSRMASLSRVVAARSRRRNWFTVVMTCCE